MSEQAIKLTQKCFTTKELKLDLGNCGLTDNDFIKGTILDRMLKKCIHLETLILSSNWFAFGNDKDAESENEGNVNHLNTFPESILVLVNLTTLICGGHSDQLPWGINTTSFISNFPKLKILSLRSNSIATISGFQGLINLEHLDIGLNKIKVIKGLEKLINLNKLTIYGNLIQQIQGLEQLTNLQHLNLYNNKISEIKGLNKLTSLAFLRLANNKIKEIKELENLNNLEYLDLHNNLISSTKGLESLHKLIYLDLNRNRVQQIDGLEKLLFLKSLDLKNNRISNIKFLLPLLKRTPPLTIVVNDLYKKKVDNEINLQDNPLTSPSIEIIEQGSETILNYFSELQKQGIEYLFEAKMLIVGQPRAGKTSLRYKLFDYNKPLPKEDKTTRGIDINRLNFSVNDNDGNKQQFYCNVWDFGGQQIYQATHQFFLTHRSLYILVIDTGKDSIGNDDTTINYWLQAIELLGGNSPLLLVRNEKNERQVNIDIPQKRARFSFLKGDYTVDLNALISGTSSFKNNRLTDFSFLKEDIEIELKRLPLVGIPMPKNWIQIREKLQALSSSKHYISKLNYVDICNEYEVTDYSRQMELSRIFHDLGIFLHFQSYPTLEEYIILQNTWATDAVFAVFDNKTIQASKGRFADNELSNIWESKGYDPIVHNMLLALMMQFELCYQVDKSNPNSYIIPEMLSDTAPDGYEWKSNNDLPLQYKYDFMPRGILTRLIVRLHKNIDQYNNHQIVWKTGVKIDGKRLDCPNTFAQITEAWNNKQLDVKVQGPFAKDLMSKVTFQIDELNNQFFKETGSNNLSQKSKWYKMIPCNCITCKNTSDKYFYDYQEILERKEFKKTTIECKKKPFADVKISELLDGVFKEQKNIVVKEEKIDLIQKQTITMFLASSSELKEERKEFEIFIGRENKRLNKKGVFLQLEIWEDFLDNMSQTRLQNEYNITLRGCDIFIMLYFTKVGKFTTEEFENAFSKFKETNNPKIYTYFKKGDIKSTEQIREDTKSLWFFQDKLKELGHFQTEFENNSDLHLHFKKQLEKLFDL